MLVEWKLKKVIFFADVIMQTNVILMSHFVKQMWLIT